MRKCTPQQLQRLRDLTTVDPRVTYDELAELWGVQRYAAWRTVQSLAARGYVQVNGRNRRKVTEVTPKGRAALE